MYNVTATALNFNQSIVNIDEDTGRVELILILSNPSSFGITVEVTDNNNTASGNYCTV